MPTSWYQTIPNILTRVEGLNPQSILDIGVGFGKYGLLFRDLLEIPFERYAKETWQIKIDGVEAFETYHNAIYDFAYNQIFYGNILELIDSLPQYDCITLIDVLEHFSKEDGLRLVEKLVAHCNKGVIISTPFYPDHQISYLGNTFEEHKSVWGLVDFQRFRYTYERPEIDQNGAHIFTLQPNIPLRSMPFDGLVGARRTTEKPLTIGYLLPHKNLTGGLKMLLQQMKHLKERGHKIVALLKGDPDVDSALPVWFELQVDREIIVPHSALFLDYAGGCDILMAGWVSQLIELRDSKIPVVYWEQGNEWLFRDTGLQKNEEAIAQVMEYCYLSQHAILSVSPYVANQILARYGRKTPILTNGIDTQFYRVGEKSNTNQILLVGNPHLAFKGFDAAFRALTLAWQTGYRFQVEWVCQATPKIPPLPFPVSVVLQPTQEQLVSCYQKADVHLFPSHYEGFGMPPLEAMACGTPVVCTRCGGIDSFVQNGHNALTSEVGDVSTMAINVGSLLKYPPLRAILAANGRKTAEELDYSNTILDLEGYLYAVVKQWADDRR